MTTLYVAGPMTGLPDFNYPAFNAAAAELRALGYTVSNPSENFPEDTGHKVPWADYLRAGVRQVLDADGVATLDRWWGSRGARLEVSVAKALGVPCAPLAAWLDGTAGLALQDAIKEHR